MKKYLRFLPFLILVLVSFIPLFWYGSGGIVIGHDTGWSLVPLERFTDRLYVWSRVGFGIDQTLDVGAVSFYGIQAFLSYAGFSIYSVQKISFIFWFLAMSFSMYFLSVTVYKGKNSWLLGMIAGIFYAVNHYTLQAWGVAELSKFSAMTLFPIILALTWGMIENKRISTKLLLLMSITFLLFNGGGGSGLPLYGGMILVFLVLFLYKLLVEKVSIFTLVKIYVVIAVVFILTGMYWIIPMAHILTSQYSAFAGSGGAEGAISWTNVISKNTSIINLLRLQGFSGWYDDPLHPFSHAFLNNPTLIVESILIPFFVLLSFLLTKSKKERSIILYFICILLLSIVFVAGTHFPFGFVYAFLMRHLYGFAIFRTAFYKFGYALWFSYAFLFAFSIIRIMDLLKKNYFKTGFILLVGILLISYNYPFFSTTFFNFDLPFKTLVNLPNYIFESELYISKLPDSSRILLVPPPSPTNGQTDIYTYGYFSRTPLPYELTQKSVVTNLEISSPAEERFTEELYSAIRANDEKKAKSLIKLMGVSDILVRNDVMVNNPTYKVDNPQDYSKNLKNYKWIVEKAEYGKWDFYHVSFPVQKILASPPNFAFTFGDTDAAVKTLQFNANEIITTSQYFDTLPNSSSKITVHVRCTLCADKSADNLTPVSPTILPNSLFYVLEELNEKRKIKAFLSDPIAYFGLQLYYSEKHALEISLLADSNALPIRNVLDIEKKTELLDTYSSYLQKTEEAFYKLSKNQQLQFVNDYQHSLERQRNYIYQGFKSYFFADLKNEYNDIYSKINQSLEKKSLRQIVYFRATHYIYSFQIPETAAYDAAFDTPVNGAKIDDSEFLPQLALTAGSHLVDLPISNDNLIEKNDQSFSVNSTKTIYAKKTSPNTDYEISLKAHIENAPSVRLEVKDNTGKVLVLQNMLNDHTSYWQSFTGVFNSGSKNTNYQLVFTSDADSENGSIFVKDLKLTSSKTPILSFQTKNITTVGRLPSIVTRYISPVHYRVTVSHADKPFVLVLNETFSLLWEAKINNQSLSQHFPADLAFNGWYIDRRGDYIIDIIVPFQKKYYIGVIISVLTLATLISLYIFINHKYARRN